MCSSLFGLILVYCSLGLSYLRHKSMWRTHDYCRQHARPNSAPNTKNSLLLSISQKTRIKQQQKVVRDWKVNRFVTVKFSVFVDYSTIRVTSGRQYEVLKQTGNTETWLRTAGILLANWRVNAQRRRFLMSILGGHFTIGERTPPPCVLKEGRSK